ncbi:MAG: hypothetical protein ABWX96_14355 [Propionibacteriaceae bacterium]
MSRRLTSYLVTDIEANGLVPGRHSMISIASVAIDQDGRELDRFEINLEPVEGTSSDPETMAWWDTQPDAWREATIDPVRPGVAVKRFIAWGQNLPGDRIFVAHPLSFDGEYVGWYLDRFAGMPLYDQPRQPGLTVAGVDLPSLVMGVKGWERQDCGRHNYPEDWLGGHVHSHRAIDDALGYASLLRHLLGEAA